MYIWDVFKFYARFYTNAFRQYVLTHSNGMQKKNSIQINFFERAIEAKREHDDLSENKNRNNEMGEKR